jgi:hypothetical protein
MKSGRMGGKGILNDKIYNQQLTKFAALILTSYSCLQTF